MILKLGSFNLFNLALPDTPVYNRVFYDQKTYNKKVKWTANQLKLMNASIVGFQEIFHVQCLDEVLKSSNIYQNATMIAPGATGEKPIVGLVTRLPVKEYQSIQKFPENSVLKFNGFSSPITTFSRPVLRTVIELPNGHDVTVFVLHMKSKRPISETGSGLIGNDPTELALSYARALFIRTAEAAALRALLVKEMQNTSTPVIILGDLNDNLHASSSEIITGPAIHRGMHQDQKERAWDVMLYSPSALEARRGEGEIYYTHIHNGFHEALDYILVSQEFIRTNPNRIGEIKYLRVLNDHIVNRREEEVPQPLWQSDHGQVVLALNLREN